MNFNGSGGLMFLIIAGLWVWVFVPSWFKRSQYRQQEVVANRATRDEIQDSKKNGTRAGISNLAERNYRLSMTQRIFTAIAFFAFATAIASIFLAVSQIFYWIVTFISLAIFAGSAAVARVARRKNTEVLLASTKSRSRIYASTSKAFKKQSLESSIAGTPVDIRGWQPIALPAPRQRIGELEMPTLAEVVEIEEQVIKKSKATLDSTALDEILRRRRANG